MKTSPSSSSSLSSSSSSPTPPLSSPCSPVKKRSKGDEAHSMYPKNVEVASYNEKTRRKGREEEGEEERDGLLSSSSSILSPSIPRGRLPSKSHKHQASPTMSGVCTPQGEGGQYMTKYYHSKSSSSSSTSSSPSKIPRLSSSSPLRHSTNLDKSDKALEREGHEEDQEKKFSSSFSSTSPSSPCKKGMNTPFSRVKHHSPSPSIKPSKDKEDNLPSSSSPLSSDVHTPSSTTTRSRYEEGTEQDLQHVRKKSESFPNARASPAVTEWKKKNNNSQKQQESTSERGGAEESRERGLSHLLEKKDHLSMKKKSHGTSRIIPSSSTLLHSQNGKKDPPQEMKEEKKGGKTQEKSFVLSHEEEEEENKKKKKQREDSRHLQHLQSKHNPSFSRPTPHPNAPSSSLAGTPQHVDAGKKRTPSMTSSALSSFSSSSSLSKVHSFQRKDSQMKKLEERPSLQAIPKVTLSILSDLIASSPSLLLQKNKNKNRFPHPASHEQPSSAPSNRPPNRSSPHTPQHKTSSSSSLQQLKKSQEPREDDSPKEEEEEEEERKKEGEECKENQRPSSTTKKQSKNEERNLPLHSSSSPSSSSSPPPQDLSTVAALDLHGRKAEEIDDLSLCKQLRRLDISENLLSSLQFTSMNLELRCLKAANNRLSSGIDLKQSLQHLSNLVVLDLSDNTQIVGLDDFSTLTSLKTLVLSGNGLKKLSFSSPIFSHLECLILSRNKIEEVEKPSKPLQSLKKLSLSDNRLKTFPFSGGFPGLHELRLNGNSLLHIGNGVLCMCELKILDLGRNQLHRIEGVKAMKDHLKLSQLNIAGNPIMTDSNAMKEIEGTILPSLPSLKIFNSRPLSPPPPENPRKLAWKMTMKRKHMQQTQEEDRQKEKESKEERKKEDRKPQGERQADRMRGPEIKREKEKERKNDQHNGMKRSDRKVLGGECRKEESERKDASQGGVKNDKRKHLLEKDHEEEGEERHAKKMKGHSSPSSSSLPPPERK